MEKGRSEEILDTTLCYYNNNVSENNMQVKKTGQNVHSTPKTYPIMSLMPCPPCLRQAGGRRAKAGIRLRNTGFPLSRERQRKLNYYALEVYSFRLAYWNN